MFYVSPLLSFLFFFFLAEDEEDTIAAQEKVEGNVDHAAELDDLTREGKPLFCSHVIQTCNLTNNCESIFLAVLNIIFVVNNTLMYPFVETAVLPLHFCSS